MTSTEEIAPERSVAAVSNADHCQIGPLGGRSLADLRDAALLGRACAPAAGDFHRRFLLRRRLVEDTLPADRCFPGHITPRMS
jgi:hypothetical protein